LQQEFNLTYIFIAHGLPVIKQISDQVAVMYLGKIVELAAKDQLFAEPLHPYTEGLLSAVPIPDPTFRDKKNIRLLEGDIPSPVNPPSGCRFHTRCPYVREMCQKEVPVLQAKANGHFVACHYPLENGAVVTVN